MSEHICSVVDCTQPATRPIHRRMGANIDDRSVTVGWLCEEHCEQLAPILNNIITQTWRRFIRRETIEGQHP